MNPINVMDQSITLRAIVACTLFLLLAAVPAPLAAQSSFLEKLQQTDVNDPASLLAMGERCEREGKASQAAKFYAMVVESGPRTRGEQWTAASLALASIEIDAGRYEDAYERLIELATLHDSEEARTRLRELKNTRARKQLEHLREGDDLLANGRLDEALVAYEEAYGLIGKGDDGREQIPPRVILRKLAACRKRIDDRYREERVIVERSVEVCAPCGKKGFVKCGTCEGDGRVTRLSGLGRNRRKVEVNCDGPCVGRGFLGCGACATLGFVSSEISRSERRAVEELIRSANKNSTLRKGLEDAIGVVEDAVLRIETGSALNYLRSIKPSYEYGKEVRSALAVVPPRPKNVGSAENAWETRSRDVRVGVNFLLGYASEFSKYVQEFDVLRGSGKPDYSARPAAPSSAESALTPELLSAFPDETSSEWLVVEATYRSYAPDPKRHKGMLELEGEAEHDVRFFTWLPESRWHLERLEERAWRSRMGGLAESYPFELGSRLERVPAGHQVVVVGRFLRDRLSDPPNWFEVWDVAVGFSPAQQAMHEALSERVEEISFPGVPLANVVRILADWFDLHVKLDGIESDRLVAVKASGCTLGGLVEGIARDGLGCAWYFDDGVVLGNEVPAARGRDVEVVLARLQASGTCEVAPLDAGARGSGAAARADEPTSGAGRAVVATGAAVSAGLPVDPAGLRVVAREAVERMDYARARACFEALENAVEDRRRRELLGRLSRKMALFDALSGRTRVSQLVDAKELASIVYTKSSGEAVPETTVEVLRSGGDSLLIQEAYGSSFTITTRNVISRRRVEPEEWKRAKMDELARRRRELADASDEDRVNKLYLLALYAKTHGEPELGHGFLAEVVALDAFEWFLSAFYPDRAEGMLALREAAFGRRGESAVAAAPEIDAGVAERAAVAKPDGDPLDAVPDDEDALLSFADRYFKEGSRCLRESLAGEASSAWRGRALDCFERARDALDALDESHPDQARVRKLRQDLVYMIQTSAKDAGFFD